MAVLQRLLRRPLGRMLGPRIGRRVRLPSGRAGKVAVAALVLVLAAATGVGAALGGPAVLANLIAAANPVRIAPPPAPVVPQPALRAVGTRAPVPSAAGLAAVLDQLAGSAALGQFAGVVLDPAGELGTQAGTPSALWSRDAGRRLVPGSTAKLVTAAAALLALDPDARLATTVVAGAEPGTVVLVGGGDPTLSALPAGLESVYPGAPKLDDLAAQVRTAVSGGVRRVLVDVGRYTGDQLGPGWHAADVPGGFVAPIVPVMLDGGRGVPTVSETPRSRNPAITAAAELARRLGAQPGSAAVGAAPPGAALLGTVRSQPIKELVAQALRISDNVLAEVLAREVALATGAPPTFAGAVDAMRAVLTANGIDTAELRLVDGSGLSTRNQVSPTALAGLLAAAAAPGRSDPRTSKLRQLLDGLPVAGGTGTLADRYDDPAGPGRGYVRAKTGTLASANSLAGVVLDVEGRLLVFALLSNGSTSTTARPALDAIAAALRQCGCR